MRIAMRQYQSAVDLEWKGYNRLALDSLEAALPTFYREDQIEWVVRSLLLWAQGSAYLGDVASAEDSLSTVEQLFYRSGLSGDLKARLGMQRGLIALLAGDVDAARNWLRLAYSVANELGERQIHDRAGCLIGWMLRAAGEYQRSIEQLELITHSIGARKADLRNLMFCANQLGLSYWYSGDLQRAESSIRESLALRIASMGDNHPIVNSVRVNLGIVSYSQGHYIESLALFEADLQGSRGSLTLDERTARAFSNIGLVYWKIGRPLRAIEYYERATAIRLRLQGENHPKLHILYNRMALAYHDLDDFDRALQYNYLSLAKKKRLGESHPELAHSYNNLGVTLLRLGRIESARMFFRRALAIRAEMFDRHPDLAMSYANLAETYASSGDWNSAIELYNKSLAIWRNAGGTGEDVAFAHVGRARARMALGQHDLALRSLDSAVAVSSSEISSSLPSKARLLALTERARLVNQLSLFPTRLRAYVAYQDAVRAWSKLVLDPRTGTTESVTDSTTHLLLTEAIRNSRQLYSSTGLRIYFNSVLRYSELAHRSATFNELLDSTTLRSHIPDSILTLDLGWRARIKDLEMTRLLTTDSIRIADELFLARNEYDKFLRQLGKKYPAYYEYRQNTAAANADSILATLEYNEALIEFFETTDSLYVITMTKESANIHTVANDVVRPVISDYMTALVTTDDSRYRHAGYLLYQLLLGPVADIIDDKDLIIVPDGRLHFVPFEPLLTAPPPSNSRLWKFGDLPYLIHRHAIEYTYSATLRGFVRSRKTKETNRAFLGVAPTFGNVTSTWPDIEMDTVSYLPGALMEVESIFSMFVPRFDIVGRMLRSNSTFLRGPDASEENLRALDLSRYRYLHFATHGYVDDESPAVSGLLMHRASKTHDDVIRVGEIYGLNLSADLVVLSACETGRGQLVEGEGVIGLTGGFMYAGARNVVVSLWQVNDRSSATLMKRFYAHALRDRDYRRALREAKLDLIRDGGRYSRPYHWAGYVIFGS